MTTNENEKKVLGMKPEQWRIVLASAWTAMLAVGGDSLPGSIPTPIWAGLGATGGYGLGYVLRNKGLIVNVIAAVGVTSLIFLAIVYSSALAPYTSPDGKFTVMFPRAHQYSQVSEEGTKVHLITSKPGAVVFNVSYWDLAKTPQNENEKREVLLEIQKRASKNHELLSEKFTTIQGRLERYFEIKTNNGALVRVKAIVDGNRGYQLAAGSKEETTGKKRIEEFLSSFKLNR